MSRLCLYAPHFESDCMDLGCRQRGGRCEVVELPGGRRSCRCAVLPPSTNVADLQGGAVVDDPLTTYRSQIARLEPCSNEWFTAALRDSRAGDDVARHRISGSCLRVALQVVERLAGHLSGTEFLDVVEEANSALWHCIDTFSGETAEDFVRHVEQSVEAHLSGHGSCAQ